MKNIKSITLKNFQSWKNSTIKFTKGLNIIIGNSDSGKSAIFRAIDSIFTGKFYPDYMRKQEKESSVKLEFDDNTKFVRGKNKTKQTAEANEIKFERIGKEMPQEYFDLLGRTNIVVGDKEIPVCLRNQDDSYFFINNSDYEKSKIIGSVCGIDIVDKVVESVNKDIRENNSKIKFLNEQIEKNTNLKEEIKNEYQIKKIDLDILTKNFDKLNNDYQFLVFLSNINCKVKSLKVEMESFLTKQKYLLEILNNFKSENLEENILLLDKLKKYWLNLNEIQYEINSLGVRYNYIDVFIKNAPNFDFLTNLVEIYDKSKKLSKTKEKIIKLNEQNDLLNKEIQLLNNELKFLMKDFKQCPLCGSEIR